ncbi:restriction endonuclease [Amycolatopsis sp. DG1A-15b]|uniref:restriction endonuclease n=1 Tax=Amycolatopsis sp. DG1A-15b TaxID=3052846 RepID=UPI00255B7C65|nr:restriction endonuclease [Amycolatopsis sp. DG1A-15b]WIX92542.1 restriction endonuclease [Amycolatopsis sp. DG1A-15b]
MAAKTITLPQIPGVGAELEDYVAALFQASGYFVEKNIVERAPDEVLELDIVATYYSSAGAESMIVEAKGGKWGYPDIFKVVGWMRYLGQRQGAFFVKNGSKDVEQVRARFDPLNVKFVDLGDFSAAIEIFKDAGLGMPSGNGDVALWRYSNMIERRMTSKLMAFMKSNGDKEGPREIVNYHRLVSNGVFFAQTALDTVALLYEAYKSHPKLSLACARELEGEPFDAFDVSGPSVLIRRVLLEGSPVLLQTSLYAEHRARLAILRGAVNLLMLEGELGLSDATYDSLPSSFCDGIAWLRKRKTYFRYPVLWQHLLWGWGGFYLTHKLDDEYKWMSSFSGVPRDEIPSALAAFDKFFPIDGGWFVEAGRSDILAVKMMPMAFQGLGVHHRAKRYGYASVNEFGGAAYTITNLARWYANTFDFLS